MKKYTKLSYCHRSPMRLHPCWYRQYKWHEKRRFNLEIQTGGHDNQTIFCDHWCWIYDCIPFKAVFWIHCSHSMLSVQPDYCGTCNTAKSCTEYNSIIWNLQSKTLIITMKLFLNYHLKLYNKQYVFIQIHSFVCFCFYIKLQRVS